MSKAKVYLDKPAIEKSIASIANRGKLLDKDIQLAGESILAHIEKHREVSLFTKLYNAMPNGSRRNALVAWAIGYGQISVNMNKETKKEQPFVFNKDATANLEGAASKPWFDFKKEKEPSEEFSLEAELASFQAKLAKWIKAGKVQEGDQLANAIMSVKPEETRSEEV